MPQPSEETPLQTGLLKLLLVGGFVLIFWALYKARHLVLLGFAGIVLAVIFSGLARKLTRHSPWPSSPATYKCAIGLIALGGTALIAGTVAFVGPNMVSDLQQLQQLVPEVIAQIKDYPVLQNLLGGNEAGLSNNLIKEIASLASATLPPLTMGIAAFFTFLVLLGFIAIFGAAQPSLYKGILVSVFPLRLRERASTTLDACADALWNWLKGQGLSMLVIGILSTTGLLLLGVEHALTLGVIAGLFQFVPYLGPIFSAVPALLVGLTISPQMTLFIALLYWAIQFAEGNFITPLAMKSEVNLPPLGTLFATVLFGILFGVLGVIIATPLAVILMTLYNEVYQKEILHATNPKAHTQTNDPTIH